MLFICFFFFFFTFTFFLFLFLFCSLLTPSPLLHQHTHLLYLTRDTTWNAAFLLFSCIACHSVPTFALFYDLQGWLGITNTLINYLQRDFILTDWFVWTQVPQYWRDRYHPASAWPTWVVTPCGRPSPTDWDQNQNHQQLQQQSHLHHRWVGCLLDCCLNGYTHLCRQRWPWLLF